MNSGKRALLAYKEKEHPGSVKLVLPSNYSSARISQIPFATGKQLAKMAEHVVSESAAEGIVDYGITYADKKAGRDRMLCQRRRKYLYRLLSNV
mgnify:FL=1